MNVIFVHASLTQKSSVMKQVSSTFLFVALLLMISSCGETKQSDKSAVTDQRDSYRDPTFRYIGNYAEDILNTKTNRQPYLSEF